MRRVILLISFLSASALHDGDFCTANGSSGVCTNILKCPAALEGLRKIPRINPVACTYDEVGTPIVCCAQKTSQTVTKRPEPLWAATPKKPRPQSTTTTEYTPEEETFVDFEKPSICPPLDVQAKSTDRKAWRKCLQYQEELVYPCENSKALLGGKVRGNNCRHNVAKLIVGGVDAAEAEFPHMVMLSHSADENALEFGCGGSLISDWFVLTAAHCTHKRLVGPVRHAVLGVLKVSRIDPSKVYKIQDIIKHPKYNSPLHYHDIALLKTDRRMHLDMFAVPACLDVGSEPDDSQALTTGWGALWNRGQNADNLQKVVLKKFGDHECRSHYTDEDRRIPMGYVPQSQMCYGDKEKSRDACSGDSGGPLQLKMARIKCMYSIIGITSFGINCGTKGVPGMYTRVANYVSWIEDVVWPDE